ncbi:MAG: protein-glutamate methylesterase/protein-glutamine glutaminase [Terriglobales bacterium]
MTQPVRVLVVDDSALMRKLIPQMLERDASIRVVDTAMDGAFALSKIEEVKPDVITLDLEMPRMHGIETLREITRRHRIPVIVVSAHTTAGATTTFKALAMGALDFVAKPAGAALAQMDEIATELISKIKIAAGVIGAAPAIASLPQNPKRPRPRIEHEPTRIIAIGISTGGPNTLQYVLSQLPGDFPGSILVVQHMPEGFTEMFARRLNDTCAIEVREARSGDLLAAGRVLICPGNHHMRLRRMPLGPVVILGNEERVNGHRPSVDVLFRSVAREFGPKAIAVLMTGMGDDGADAMAEVKAAGGLTIAQSAESCVVFGMPKAAIERGHAERVLSLDGLASALQAQCKLGSTEAASTAAAQPAR